MRRAVFLDRDGTINLEVDYLDSPDRFRLLPNVGEAIAELNKAGWLVIVISNQSGVARGKFSEETLELISQEMRAQLEERKARIDDIFYCTHHPDDHCSCRKPSPELILKAAGEYGIDLANSWMVGDTRSDLMAGKNAGCRTALVLTGHGKREAGDDLTTDHVADDLSSVIDHILNDGNDYERKAR